METVGLIPAAGKGSRLGLPFSKEMFPDIYNNQYRPIIMYTIEAMKLAGIKHLIFTVNPKKSDLFEFLGNGKQFDMDFSFCVHPNPKSLPESLNEAHHLIRDKRVVFAMPDTIITPKTAISETLKSHLENDKAEVTLGCFKTENPTSVSVVDFKGNKVINVIEKPKFTELEWMWGLMVWDPVFSHDLNKFVKKSKPRDGVNELYMSDALSDLIIKDRIYAKKFYGGKYRDLGTYQSINSWSMVEV